MARENKPSIIFIDEIDSVCSTRSDSESESARRVKTEFLVQMQGVSNSDQSGVLVLAATNIPWGLDSAIRRRFEKRIYIPLPDTEARKALFKLHIGSTLAQLTEQDYNELAAQTEGYSGSDLSIVVRNALMEPIRAMQRATHFKQISGPDPSNPGATCHDLWTPVVMPPDISPEDRAALLQQPGVRIMSLFDITDHTKVVPPPVTLADFTKSIKASRPSVNNEDIQMHVKFMQEFGSEW
eukprot:GEZU01016248.1.p1 GENE.GEZU01016248.1~~GEZU01016248.1.p1  ORF type:complete len:239 (-),score=56.02 GEZU01016248.1:241-957(-)